MKTDWTLIQREEEEQLARLAAACVARLGKPGLPVDALAMLQRCRATTVLTARQLISTQMPLPEPMRAALRKCGALTWCRGEREEERRYIVLYRDDLPPAERRWNLAHELGHRILRHAFSETVEERHPKEEAAADLFAGHLLAPQPVLRALCGEKGEKEAAKMLGMPEEMLKKMLGRYVFFTDRHLEETICELLLGKFETESIQKANENR